MNPIQLGNLEFSFDSHLSAVQLDVAGGRPEGWPRTKDGKDTKVVDIVAHGTTQEGSTAWLIEVKDFRKMTDQPNEKNNAGLAETVSEKVRSSLAGLDAVANFSADSAIRAHAIASIGTRHRRVALHLEPHASPSTLSFKLVTPANVQAKLRQLLHDIDPHPYVLTIATTPHFGVPWAVR